MSNHIRAAEKIKTFYHTIGDLLFPGNCVCCFRPLLGQSVFNSELCRSCFLAITPLGGERCRICGCPLISEHMTCLSCRERSYFFDAHSSVLAYSGKVKEIIGQYKFNSRKRLLNVLGYLFYQNTDLDREESCLVPVPDNPSNRRSWSPVGYLCRYISRRTKIPLWDCLRRKRGPSQKLLNYQQRIQNLEKKICLKGPAGEKLSRMKTVYLIDDIFTSGASCSLCARVLKEQGAGRVIALTLAMD